MTTLLAQDLPIPGTTGTLHGPLDPTKFPNLASVVTNLMPILYAVAGVILFIFLILGGFDYLTSMGDPKKAESGKNKITYAILGFIIIFITPWLVQIISYLFKLGR